jgi:hypothetical protein
MKILVLLAALAVLAAALTVPAGADHNTPPRNEPGLQLDAHFGERAFQLGARLLTSERTFGAWLSADTKGPRLEGRLERDGRPLEFSWDGTKVREFFERWLPRQ